MIWRLSVLVLPVAAGLGWAVATDANSRTIGSMMLASVVAACLIAIRHLRSMPVNPTGLVMVALLIATAVVGIEHDGARRWVAIGPIVLTASLVCMPPLAVLAARAKRSWLIGGLAAVLLAGLLQPDGSILLALSGIIAGLARRNFAIWTAALLCAGLGMAMALTDGRAGVRGVEHVLQDAWTSEPVAAVVLAGAFAAALGILAFVLPARRLPGSQTRALAGCLFMLLVASFLGPYPTPLIGLAPSAVLGTGLGLAMLGRAR